MVMITATNKQCEIERVKVSTFTRSLKLARVETLGSTQCSSYHYYYEPKVLEYFNRTLIKSINCTQKPLEKISKGQ